MSEKSKETSTPKDSVTIPKTELDKILKSFQELQEVVSGQNKLIEELKTSSGNATPKVLREVKERTVRLKLVDGKPVIGFANKGTDTRPVYVYKAPNPQDPRNDILFIDVLTLGAKEPVKMVYAEFITDMETLEVKVKNIKEEHWTIEQGQVVKREVRPDFSIVETDYIVPVEVKGVHRTYIVDFKDKELEVDEAFINI